MQRRIHQLTHSVHCEGHRKSTFRKPKLSARSKSAMRLFSLPIFDFVATLYEVAYSPQLSRIARMSIDWQDHSALWQSR